MEQQSCLIEVAFLFGTEIKQPQYDSLGLVKAVFIFGTENKHPRHDSFYFFVTENSHPRPGSSPAHPVSPLGCFRGRPLVIALPH